MDPIIGFFALFLGLQPQAVMPAARPQPQLGHQLRIAKQKAVKVRFVARPPLPRPRPVNDDAPVVRVNGVEVLWLGQYQLWPYHMTFVG